ncbi:Cu-binding protein [Orbilia oligospora]|uniref:Cu-binding protein n=1 Tax=Orbilia oligospora TaxID=2813651 RepID=A0A7C8PJL1_ORBOL|nr:Cu-binding protein [Orbilia oligospora]KAF3285168.1 Cu-binding protein [Orbilia oligospora]TGJ68126.1 Cu-binding protein [Orbilia oligospora]
MSTLARSVSRPSLASARLALSTPVSSIFENVLAPGVRRRISTIHRSQTSPLRPAICSPRPNVRTFSTSPRSEKWGMFKTVQEAEARHKSGPFSFRAGALFVLTGVGLYSYFTYEKGRMERMRVTESHKGVGKARIGGEFTLTDQNGQRITDKEARDGKFSLVYFGFTHCPDICPEELDKMAVMIDKVYEKRGKSLQPIFITCDPARDTPKVMKEYLNEFHPALVGLTGTYDEIKDVCKKYRVYFSTPRDLKEGMDYLVDHSIYFYLMDPDGNFVEALGRQHTAHQAADIISTHIGDWKGPVKIDA